MQLRVRLGDMGNREDLLAGARRVILERGIAKATARDIATASGVSLAAIGYHFGSKDGLIAEALVDALGTGVGDDIEASMTASASLPLLDGFAQWSDDLPAIFARHREAMLASLENTLRVLRDPESSGHAQTGVLRGYRDMAENFRAARPDLSDEDLDAVAKLAFVLTQSLGIFWLLDPEHTIPSGDVLARGIAVLAHDRGQTH